MLCTKAIFVVIKKPWLVIYHQLVILFDSAGPNLLTFLISEPYPSEDIALVPSSVISDQWCH